MIAARFAAPSRGSGLSIGEPRRFTSGTPARRTRGEIICISACTERIIAGNAGIVLQKNDISPNDDRMTDFLLAAA